MAGSPTTQGRVLVIDSDSARAVALEHRLRYLDYEARRLQTIKDLDSVTDEIATVVGDVEADPETAALLEALQEKHPKLPILRLLESPAAPADHRAPNWQLDIPLKRAQLVRLLRRAQRYRGSERRHRLTGRSRPIRMVRDLIEKVADFDTTVLITGESGTGKELVARTIHDLSDRADRTFVPINCGAIPAELLESELFGHEKGAFTGAIAARTGRFELAEGGTLFLDEVGDMSQPMQVKLLRVLQERTFERVGSNRSRECDVRVVAATHRDLAAAVEAGDFRQDLFYRLNVFPIVMPPLYKRISDLPMLLDELLISHGGENPGDLRISAEALDVLARYRWPGNIRELSNLVERLAILKPEGIIEVSDLPGRYCEVAAKAPGEPNNVAAALKLTQANLKQHLQSLEQDLIGQAMLAADGVVAKAAKLLHMRRTTLVEKIGKYDLR